MLSIKNIFSHKEYLEIFILFLSMFFLLLKGGYGVEEYEISNLPTYIYVLKDNSATLAFIFFIFLFFYFFIFYFKIRFSITAILMLLLLFIYYLRSYFLGGDFRNIISMFLIVVLFLYFSSFLLGDRLSVAYKGIYLSLSIWLFLNVFLYFLGYGYNLMDNTSRFIGTSIHPNSTGAYATISLVFFVLNFLNFNKYNKIKTISLIMILISIYLVFISGSRAALFCSSLILFLILPFFYKFVVFLLGGSGIFFANSLINSKDGSIYSSVDRIKNAPLDNRDEVWGILIKDFLNNPFLGAGDVSGVSGSGYLTAFGGAGFLGGMIFVLIMGLGFFVISKSFLKNFNNIEFKKKTFLMFFLVISILSLFEGYIFDKFGFIQILFLMTLTIIGPYHLTKGINSHQGVQ